LKALYRKKKQESNKENSQEFMNAMDVVASIHARPEEKKTPS
jgi:uncharacterized phage-like protein YoqJ